MHTVQFMAPHVTIDIYVTDIGNLSYPSYDLHVCWWSVAGGLVALQTLSGYVRWQRPSGGYERAPCGAVAAAAVRGSSTAAVAARWRRQRRQVGARTGSPLVRGRHLRASGGVLRHRGGSGGAGQLQESHLSLSGRSWRLAAARLPARAAPNNPSYHAVLFIG